MDDVTAGQDGTGRPLGPSPQTDGVEPSEPDEPAVPDVPAASVETAVPDVPGDDRHAMHVVAQSLHPIPAQPRRSPAIWAVMGALVVVLVLVVTVSASAGALALAAVLVTAGVCRAVLPGDVVGLAVRSRTADVVFYLFLAAAMAFLAQTAPNL